MTSFYKHVSAAQPDMPYTILWPLAFCWRIFSNRHFWDALQTAKAVSTTAPPEWSRVRRVMEQFRAQGVSWYGGLFYSGNKLLKFRFASTDSWQSCTACRMDDIDRLITAMKVVWRLAGSMRGSLLALQTCPTRELWKMCTEEFLGKLQDLTVGMYGHYALKKALDAILICQPHLERVVSWWPMRCPAYLQLLPKLYPGLSRTDQDLFQAAVHFHRQLKSSFPTFRLRDSLAQLCWIERKIT